MIPLPPHSSHISQILDVSIFSPLKKRYAVTQSNKDIESQLTRKLMRIKSTYTSTMSEELICSGWEEGFNIEITKCDVTCFSFSEQFKGVLHSEALHGN